MVRTSVNSNAPCFSDNALLPSENEADYSNSNRLRSTKAMACCRKSVVRWNLRTKILNNGHA